MGCIPVESGDIPVMGKTDAQLFFNGVLKWEREIRKLDVEKLLEVVTEKPDLITLINLKIKHP